MIVRKKQQKTLVIPFIQEFERFKTFAQSLLNKETKLSDLVTDLGQALQETGKPPESVEAKRVAT